MSKINLESVGMRSVFQPALNLDQKAANEYLLVILHGRGDSPQGWITLQAEMKIPGLNVLLLTAPDPYFGGFSWYDLTPDQLPGILRSRKLLESAFTEIFKQGFPPERCILFGFSQGCLMTLEFGARFPQRLAGYIGMSGYCYDTQALLREADREVMKADWLITHGTVDDVIPVVPVREQMRELKAGGLNLEYREYPKAHTIHPDEEIYIKEWIKKRMK